MDTVLNNFRNTTQSNQHRILETQSMRNDIRLSFDKKVTQVLDSFDMNVIESVLKTKAGFDKTVRHEVLGEILMIIRAQHEGSINDFDCVMILYNNVPIYCFVNSGKFRVTEVRTELERHRRNVKRKDNESSTDKQRGEEDTEVDLDKFFYVPQLLADMDDILAGENKEMFQKLCALQLDEYSYCLDLNHDVHRDSDLSSEKKLVYVGLVAALALGGTIGFTHFFKR